VRTILLVIPLAALASCGITAEQRRDIIDFSVRQAGMLAEEKAAALLEKGIEKALEAAKKAGATADDLKVIETKLREEGRAGIAKLRAEAEEKVANELDKRLPQSPPDGKGGGWLGDLLLAILPLAANVGMAYLGKRGGGA
jgi:hypothetical protein